YAAIGVAQRAALPPDLRKASGFPDPSPYLNILAGRAGSSLCARKAGWESGPEGQNPSASQAAKPRAAPQSV
ncbi:MAG: hypothetical protein ACRD3O_11510, partial [Terriglobia bacterium]